MAEFIENKFWVVFPYHLVRHLRNLQLSPAAVKEERDRKPRLLCDHSWNWDWPPINETTIHHAPPEAMQFGRTLRRILTQIRHANPKFGPPRASKHDLKDGFYRMFLNASDCPRLALILPQYEEEPQLVAIPMATTMGWVQSPPTFSVMSESVCDISNARFQASPLHVAHHRLEDRAALHDDLSRSMTPRPRSPEDAQADLLLAAVPGTTTLPPERDHVAPPSNRLLTRPLGTTDVFVDDVIQLGQGGRRRMKALRGHLLEAIDAVLSQPASDESHRQEAVSLKKLLKGDGSWATRKLILGWIINALRQTMELPPHRKATLAHIFTDLASRRRVSHKKWQRYLG